MRFFDDKVFWKSLLRLTLPIALQNLMLAMVAACDAVMLGRVGQDSMAAVSLATQIQFVQNMTRPPWATCSASAYASPWWSPRLSSQDAPSHLRR